MWRWQTRGTNIHRTDHFQRDVLFLNKGSQTRNSICNWNKDFFFNSDFWFWFFFPPGLFFKNLTKLAEMVIEAHLKSVSSFFISSENFDTFEFFVKGYLVVAQRSLGSGAQHRVEVRFYTPPSCHQFPLAVRLGAGEQREEATRVLWAGRKMIQYLCNFFIIGLCFHGRRILKSAFAAGVMRALQGRMDKKLPWCKAGFEWIQVNWEFGLSLHWVGTWKLEQLCYVAIRFDILGPLFYEILPSFYKIPLRQEGKSSKLWNNDEPLKVPWELLFWQQISPLCMQSQFPLLHCHVKTCVHYASTVCLGPWSVLGPPEVCETILFLLLFECGEASSKERNF